MFQDDYIQTVEDEGVGLNGKGRGLRERECEES